MKLNGVKVVKEAGMIIVIFSFPALTLLTYLTILTSLTNLTSALTLSQLLPRPNSYF
jgi:hypothetical protein